MSISVILRLPLLGAQSGDGFRNHCSRLGLNVRPSLRLTPSPTESIDNVQANWEVYSHSVLGTSEVTQVNRLIVGCYELVKIERALERGISLAGDVDSGF